MKHVEPPRLLASLSEAAPDARRLLDELDDHEPTQAELDRLTARLSSVLEPPVPGKPAAPSAAAAKALLALAGAGLLALAAIVALRGPPQHPALLDRFGAAVPRVAISASAAAAAAAPEPEPEPVPESVTEPVPVPDLAKPERVQLPTARAHATESPAPPAPSALAEPTPATPVDEAELLMRAHAALQRGDAAQALSLVAEHEALPGAKLGQERERIAIEALLRAGRRAAAVERAERFLARFPRSSYRRRIETLLAPPPSAHDEPAPRDDASDHKP